MQAQVVFERLGRPFMVFRDIMLCIVVAFALYRQVVAWLYIAE